MSMKGSSCIFPVPDMRKTAAFYVNSLGFTAVEFFNCKDPHICLYLDDTEIILLRANKDRVQPNRELYGNGYDAYLYTDDQVTLEQDFISKGVLVVKPLSVSDYENEEFVIEDIDGRWLAFGLKQPVGSLPAKTPKKKSITPVLIVLVFLLYLAGIIILVTRAFTPEMLLLAIPLAGLGIGMIYALKENLNRNDNDNR